MDNIFCENIVVDGKQHLGIFDVGLNKKKTIRGTQLNDTRSFVLLSEKFEVGGIVKREGKSFKIAEREDSSVGFYTYFLESDDGRSGDYLNQN